jgi:hypothetical protein
MRSRSSNRGNFHVAKTRPEGDNSGKEYYFINISIANLAMALGLFDIGF